MNTFEVFARGKKRSNPTDANNHHHRDSFVDKDTKDNFQHNTNLFLNQIKKNKRNDGIDNILQFRDNQKNSTPNLSQNQPKNFNHNFFKKKKKTFDLNQFENNNEFTSSSTLSVENNFSQNPNKSSTLYENANQSNSFKSDSIISNNVKPYGRQSSTHSKKKRNEFIEKIKLQKDNKYHDQEATRQQRYHLDKVFQELSGTIPLLYTKSDSNRHISKPTEYNRIFQNIMCNTHTTKKSLLSKHDNSNDISKENVLNEPLRVNKKNIVKDKNILNSFSMTSNEIKNNSVYTEDFFELESKTNCSRTHQPKFLNKNADMTTTSCDPINLRSVKDIIDNGHGDSNDPGSDFNSDELFDRGYKELIDGGHEGTSHFDSEFIKSEHEDSEQGEVNDSEQGEVNDSEQGEVNDSEQGEVNDSEQGEVNDSEQGEMNDSEQGEMSDSEHDRYTNSYDQNQMESRSNEMISSPAFKMIRSKAENANAKLYCLNHQKYYNDNEHVMVSKSGNIETCIFELPYSYLFLQNQMEKLPLRAQCQIIQNVLQGLRLHHHPKLLPNIELFSSHMLNYTLSLIEKNLFFQYFLSNQEVTILGENEKDDRISLIDNLLVFIHYLSTLTDYVEFLVKIKLIVVCQYGTEDLIINYNDTLLEPYKEAIQIEQSLNCYNKLSLGKPSSIGLALLYLISHIYPNSASNSIDSICLLLLTNWSNQIAAPIFGKCCPINKEWVSAYPNNVNELEENQILNSEDLDESCPYDVSIALYLLSLEYLFIISRSKFSSSFIPLCCFILYSVVHYKQRENTFQVISKSIQYAMKVWAEITKLDSIDILYTLLIIPVINYVLSKTSSSTIRELQKYCVENLKKPLPLLKLGQEKVYAISMLTPKYINSLSRQGKMFLKKGRKMNKANDLNNKKLKKDIKKQSKQIYEDSKFLSAVQTHKKIQRDRLFNENYKKIMTTLEKDHIEYHRMRTSVTVGNPKGKFKNKKMNKFKHRN